MGFPKIEISATEQVSDIVRRREVRKIDADDVARWLENWINQGFLD